MTAQNTLIKTFAFSLVSLLVLFVLTGEAKAAALQLNSPGGSYSVGNTFDVKIDLSLSSESVDGVDAILNYNTSVLSVDKITNGSLFVDYPTATYDSSQGTISVSGLASSTSPVTAGGTVATITFKGESEGTGTVTFNFTSGSGTDSNVAENTTGNDILESVVNGSYTIGSGGIGGGTDTDEGTGLPTTGNQPITAVLFLVGIVLLTVGWSFRFFRV